MIRSGKLLSGTGEATARIDLAEAVNGMLKAFRVRGDAVAAVSLYVGQLSDLDVDDVVRALGRFSRNVVPGHDNRFEPNPVQVREEIRRVNEMFRPADRPARVVLPAPKIEPRTAEQKAKVDELVAGLRKEMGKPAAAGAVGPTPRGPMHPWLREYHARWARERGA